jgi:hypothetical protein
MLTKVENVVKVESVGEFELKGIRRPIAAYNCGVRRYTPVGIEDSRYLDCMTMATVTPMTTDDEDADFATRRVSRASVWFPDKLLGGVGSELAVGR